MQNNLPRMCAICLGEKGLNHSFFKVKGDSPSAKRLGWKPWIWEHSKWTQEFLNVNFANGEREICCYCLQSVKLSERKLYRQFRTKPKGERETHGPFDFVLTMIVNREKFPQYTRPIWEWGCCEMLANRIFAVAKEMEAA